MSIGFVVLRFAAVNRLHVESMSQHEYDLFSSAEIRQPVPREDAFHSDNNVLSKWSNGFQKRFRLGFHVAMENDRAGLIEMHMYIVRASR